jgi:class 3 adenylate cyclase
MKLLSKSFSKLCQVLVWFKWMMINSFEQFDLLYLLLKFFASLPPSSLTVMFGDIVGFTAWSSVREPTQVFTLLETIYHAFDEIARKRRVFKVETVGDCYVAVCGLPDPRKDHAVVMCRFARDCMYKMWALTKALEVVLGPDTGDLSMRVGLHSGPVTAGVLRGERSRFQLFGDTMNTAARMESNGKKSRIHLSQETADLLINAGKQNWLIAREDKIIAKGKGELQTYWLDRSDKGETVISGNEQSDDVAKDNLDDAAVVVADKSGIDPAKTERLIDWTVEVLVRLLKQVVGRRRSNGRELFRMEGSVELILKPARGQTVLDEVKEIITLPRFDAAVNAKNEAEVELGPRVVEQLHDYVWNVASMYRNNAFHNFEHASHVSMSVIKLLSRIVAPSETQIPGEVQDASSLHDHTYGITSDPLTQFSCVLSALIHDMDHPGVPNAQLVKENSQLSSVYKGKSVAEQNSVDMAWHLLMDERYIDLRGAIYVDDIEMRRFRQLVVNSVMATDIVDKELKNLRNDRWEKAFSDINHEEDAQVSINRKATIVIEHLIQASDVAHTMQHWHIYRKWNERFFMECYKAYKDGRSDTDPSINWYQGEIGFFDFYIIPLAKKLKNCGVFGVSSDEYLNYAVQNRQEWEQRGQEDVAKMMQKVNAIWGDN